MKYILILANGNMVFFYIKECAELYLMVHGGVLKEVELG